MSTGSARPNETYEDIYWSNMLAYDTLAREYGWTIAEIDETPEQVIDDLAEIWNARGRVVASKSRKSHADNLAQQMTAQWKGH